MNVSVINSLERNAEVVERKFFAVGVDGIETRD